MNQHPRHMADDEAAITQGPRHTGAGGAKAATPAGTTGTRNAGAAPGGQGDGDPEKERKEPAVEPPADDTPGPDAGIDPDAGVDREVGDIEDPDAEEDGALPGRVGGGLAGG